MSGEHREWETQILLNKSFSYPPIILYLIHHQHLFIDDLDTSVLCLYLHRHYHTPTLDCCRHLLSGLLTSILTSFMHFPIASKETSAIISTQISLCYSFLNPLSSQPWNPLISPSASHDCPHPPSLSPCLAFPCLMSPSPLVCSLNTTPPPIRIQRIELFFLLSVLIYFYVSFRFQINRHSSREIFPISLHKLISLLCHLRAPYVLAHITIAILQLLLIIWLISPPLDCVYSPLYLWCLGQD